MHPLDHPVWHALTTRQAALAEGGALARRYPSDIAPFAAMPEISAQNFAALGALMSPSDFVVLFTPDPVTAPPEFKTLLAKTGEQMIGMPAETAGSDARNPGGVLGAGQSASLCLQLKTFAIVL